RRRGDQREITDPDDFRRLRGGSARRGEEGNSDEADKVAPVHYWITSSAPSSSDVGIAENSCSVALKQQLVRPPPPSYSNGANWASRHRIASPRPLVRRISSNVAYSGVPCASSRLHASTPYWSAARSPMVSKVLLIARLFHWSAASATRDMRLAIFMVSRSSRALGKTRSTSPSRNARSPSNVSPV